MERIRLYIIQWEKLKATIHLEVSKLHERKRLNKKRENARSIEDKRNDDSLVPSLGIVFRNIVGEGEKNQKCQHDMKVFFISFC